MAERVEEVLTRLSAASHSDGPGSDARVAFCLPDRPAPQPDDVRLHRMRLLTLECHIGRYFVFSYGCPCCGFLLTLTLEEPQAAGFGVHLSVTAVQYRTQFVVRELPGDKPLWASFAWLVTRKVARDVHTFYEFLPSSPPREEYVSAVLRAGEPTEYYLFDNKQRRLGHVSKGVRIPFEMFEEFCDQFNTPVMAQRVYPDGSYHSSMTYPPEQVGVLLDRGIFSAEAEGVKFLHPDGGVANAARALFELAPELAEEVVEFDRKMQAAIRYSAEGLSADRAAKRVKTLYALRDDVMARLVTLLKDVALPAGARWEARRRELLSMTPLGRAALARGEAPDRTRASNYPSEFILSPRQRLRLREGVWREGEAEGVEHFEDASRYAAGPQAQEGVPVLDLDRPDLGAEEAGFEVRPKGEDEPGSVYTVKMADFAPAEEPHESLVTALRTPLTRTITLRK